MPIAAKISTLWIVVMFNMVFADILSFMKPGFLAEVATGIVDGIVITPWFLLLAALFIEIAIVMIALSRFLGRKWARRLNLVAAPVTILFVVGGGSFQPHYILLAGVEVLAMVWIVMLAWSWREGA